MSISKFFEVYIQIKWSIRKFEDDSLWGLKLEHKRRISRRERWDFTVVMSTAKNLKFFVKRLGGPSDKERSNYLLIRCEQRQGNLHGGRRR